MILHSPKSNQRTRVRRNSPEHRKLTAMGWIDVTPGVSPAQLAQQKRWILLGLVHRTIQGMQEIQRQCKDYLDLQEESKISIALDTLTNSTLPKIREGG